MLRRRNEKKEKMLLPICFLLLLINATVGKPPHQTEPSLLMTKVEIYVLVKFDFQITCKASAPIKKCFFQFQNSASAINVPDGFSGIADFSYVGAGYENGECGIDLDAKWDMEGNVSCGVQLEENGQNLTAHGKIFVDSAIGASVLESNCKITDLLQCNEGQPMQFRCRAKAGKYSEAELILGNETLDTAKGSKWANSKIRNAEFSDNGKLVRCKVTHPASDLSYITQKPLEILFAPRPVEEVKDGILYVPNSFIPDRKGSIRIMVAANPKLSAVHWTVNGKEADGKKYQPLSINQSTFLEPHWWEVGIDVDPFTEDDLQTTFKLQLTNEVGTKDVLVQIYQESFSWSSVILLSILVIVVAFCGLLFCSYRRFMRGHKYTEDERPLLKSIFLWMEVSFVKSENCPTSKVHKDELKRAQAQEVVKWSEDFIFADTECLQKLSKHSANSDLNDLGEWHLVKHVKSSFMIPFLKVFEGKLFFNAAKRQLVVVCNDSADLCKSGTDNFSYFCIYPAVIFGEEVRLIVNNFRVEPLVLATGQGGGGCLAQVLTFSMKNLQVENNEFVRLAEKGVHCHTVTFEAPPSFRAIEDLAKDPLDQDALRLAITNHISDQQLVDCCSRKGPHVGRVVFQKKQQRDEEQPLQQKQVLSNVGSSNLNFARFDLEDLNEVKSFAAAKQEESNGAIPWFFFDKSEWDLLKWEDSKQESERNKKIPPFQFNKTSDVQSEVSENEFVARFRHLSRVIFNIYDMPQIDYKLSFNKKNYFSSLNENCVLSGFSSDQEQEFVAQLCKNSISGVRFMRQNKFVQLSGAEKSQWLNEKESTLILLVSENETVAVFNSAASKVVYFTSNEVAGSEKWVPLKLKDLDFESATKIWKVQLPFFGSNVPVEQIFSQNLLEELSLMEILNFKCVQETKSTCEKFIPQVISSDFLEFENSSSFADHLLSESKSISLISSEAGMGKTRCLEELEVDMRNKCPPSFWVCKVDLSECCGLLKSAKDSGVVNAAEFICKAMAPTETSSSQVMYKVLSEKMKSGSAWILLDAFNEVCPTYRKEATDLISLSQKLGARLLVATRPIEENTLNVDKSNIYKLNFLRGIQIQNYLSASEENKRLHALFENQFAELLRVPLLLHVAMGMWKKNNDCASMNEAELFNFTLDESLEHTLSHKIKLDASVALISNVRDTKKKAMCDLLGRLALDAVFHKGICDWISEEEAQEVNVFDIAQVTNQVSFMHRTYAEFLCVRYILDTIINPPSDKLQQMKSEINDCLTLPEHQKVRKMLENCCNLEFALDKKADQHVKYVLENWSEILGKIICENLIGLYKVTTDLFDLSKEIVMGKESKLPLFWALKSGNEPFVEVLVSQGAKASSPLFNGKQTMLHVAVKNGNNDFVKQHYANLKGSLNSEDEVGCTALHYAAQEESNEMVQFLLEKGAKFKVFDKEGKTALHYAVQSGNEQITKMLLDKDKMLTKNDESCLHLAAKYGHLHLVQHFITSDPINGRTKDGSTPLSFAILNEHTEIVNYLLENRADVYLVKINEKKDTLLHWSAVKGDLDLFKLFRPYFRSIDVLNGEGITALQKATFHGHCEIVKFLIENKANCEIQDTFGCTCLHVAASQGHLQLVKIFASKLAVDVRDNSGATPLHFASKGGHLQVVQLLLQLGADLHAVDNEGNNCLHSSALSGNTEVVQFFEHMGVEYIKNKIGHTPIDHAEVYNMQLYMQHPINNRACTRQQILIE